MSRSRIVAALLGLWLVLFAGHASAGTLEEFSVEGWYAGAYTDENTGQFSHCAGSAEYNSGSYVIVSVFNDFGWAISVGNDNWTWVGDAEFPVSIRIDGGPWLDEKAYPLNRQMFQVPMSGDATAITLFRRGHLLEVADGKGLRAKFDLSGTSRLVAALAQCVTQHTTVASNTTGGSSNAAPSAGSLGAGSNNAANVFSGTGILISQDGAVLTNNHVVAGCADIVVQRAGQVPQGALVVNVDKENDLAVLRLSGSVSADEVANFRLTPPVKAGESIAVYGFPLAGTLSTSGNIVGGNISALAGLGDDARFVQITAPIQPGNSGGPLLDLAGNVVGIVNSKLDEMKLAANTGDFPQNVNFAIKANIAANFLEAHGLELQQRPTGESVDLAAVADRARSFTVLIVCQ